MHTSLRVIGVLPDLVVSEVLGLGLCRWASPQAVHEPVGVVLMRVIVSSDDACGDGVHHLPTRVPQRG